MQHDEWSEKVYEEAWRGYGLELERRRVLWSRADSQVKLLPILLAGLGYVASQPSAIREGGTGHIVAVSLFFLLVSVSFVGIVVGTIFLATVWGSARRYGLPPQPDEIEKYYKKLRAHYYGSESMPSDWRKKLRTYYASIGESRPNEKAAESALRQAFQVGQCHFGSMLFLATKRTAEVNDIKGKRIFRASAMFSISAVTTVIAFVIITMVPPHDPPPRTPSTRASPSAPSTSSTPSGARDSGANRPQ